MIERSIYLQYMQDVETYQKNPTIRKVKETIVCYDGVHF